MYIVNQINQKENTEKRLIKIFEHRKDAELYLENCIKLNAINLSTIRYKLEKLM